jgi:hypothetical protein
LLILTCILILTVGVLHAGKQVVGRIENVIVFPGRKQIPVNRFAIDNSTLNRSMNLVIFFFTSPRFMVKNRFNERPKRFVIGQQPVKLEPFFGQAVSGVMRFWKKNGFSVDRRRRAETNEFLQTKDPSNIFVTGDCALTTDAHGKNFGNGRPVWFKCIVIKV